MKKSKNKVAVIDPYNWWPDSRNLFNTSTIYVVFTNIDKTEDNRVKYFGATTKLGKFIEILVKLPILLFENRKNKTILMWNVVPIYCLLLLLICRVAGYDVSFWMHNSVPHKFAKYTRRFVPIIWFFAPFFIPIISMNRGYIYFELRCMRWLRRFGWIDVQRTDSLVYFRSYLFGVLRRQVTFFPHGCLLTKNSGDYIQLHNKVYDIGIFGRIQSYKYDKQFWLDLLSYAQKFDRKVIICGNGNIPQAVISDPRITIRNEWVSDTELCELMAKTKLVIVKHQYIDASGIIIKCIENMVMFVSTSVGGNANFFGFKAHFEDLYQNIFIKAENIISDYVSYEQIFIQDCKKYQSLFAYKRLGDAFAHHRVKWDWNAK